MPLIVVVYMELRTAAKQPPKIPYMLDGGPLARPAAAAAAEAAARNPVPRNRRPGPAPKVVDDHGSRLGVTLDLLSDRH